MIRKAPSYQIIRFAVLGACLALVATLCWKGYARLTATASSDEHSIANMTEVSPDIREEIAYRRLTDREHPARAPIPPIDAAAPTVTETATFALG
jgi:hypothetical protein